jgi:hypothetical protein
MVEGEAGERGAGIGLRPSRDAEGTKRRGGWVWNIWGYDCVVIRMKRGTLRVGTDDADGLVEFLRSRTT